MQICGFRMLIACSTHALRMPVDFCSNVFPIRFIHVAKVPRMCLQYDWYKAPIFQYVLLRASSARFPFSSDAMLVNHPELPVFGRQVRTCKDF